MCVKHDDINITILKSLLKLFWIIFTWSLFLLPIKNEKEEEKEKEEVANFKKEAVEITANWKIHQNITAMTSSTAKHNKDDTGRK